MGTLRAALLATAILGTAACSLPTPPTVFDVRSRQVRTEAHRCVVAALVDADFQITESRVDDGLVRARRAATERWSYFWAEWDVIEVLVFSRDDAATGLQFTAKTIIGDDDKEASEEVRSLAREIADTCG
jgi:hypothetical protein